MSSNRIGPQPPPEPSRGSSSADSKKFREEMQKVQKVKEVDPDEPSRQRNKRFAARMGDEETPEDLQPRKASPFETSFHMEKKGPVRSQPPLGARGIDPKADGAIPSPAYSPPPTIDSPPPVNLSDSSAKGLPNSTRFWNEVDLPDEPLSDRQNFRETARSQERTRDVEPEKEKPLERKADRKKKIEGDEELKPKKGELSPFDLPMNKGAKKQVKGTEEEETASPFMMDDEELETPVKMKGKPREFPPFESTKEAPQGFAAPSAPSFKAREKEPSARKPTGEEILPTASPFAPIDPSGDREGGRGGHRNPFEHGAMEIVQPSFPSFPVDIQPIAQSAAVQASPYLSSESMSLFYQMVGMIYVMTSSSGISRTEVVLNAPAFANSKFFGSTITIEKYATAPDSLNIRLTGTNEAVQAFNQNLSSLVAAFQNGNFNFRIGRIDTAYSVDKPVFRRKERGEGDAGNSKEKKR